VLEPCETMKQLSHEAGEAHGAQSSDIPCSYGSLDPNPREA
jgi:hypothetical protein